MKILHVLPRRMSFDRDGASSVELCVAEWISGSRYRHETTVLAERGTGAPLLDIDIRRLREMRHLSSWHQALAVRRIAATEGFDLIVTQQHVPTAARIAMASRGVPVVMQAHNFLPLAAAGKTHLRHRLHTWQINRLAGITMVGETVRQRFEEDWPEVVVPCAVVPNGFDFSRWNADRLKDRRIQVVGRVLEGKGILEAAQAVTRSLLSHSDYRTTFILSGLRWNLPYFDTVLSALWPVADRVEVLTDVDHEWVRELTETSAISIVASREPEAFGRTALEAHAGGSALISSGVGGLREVSGEHAVYLADVSAEAIAACLDRLIADAAYRIELARLGAKRVRQLFSLGQVCAGLDRFYENVVERRRAGAR